MYRAPSLSFTLCILVLFFTLCFVVLYPERIVRQAEFAEIQATREYFEAVRQRLRCKLCYLEGRLDLMNEILDARQKSHSVR